VDRCRSFRKGIQEAHEAGKLLKKEGFHFEKAYTSYLKRAIKTLNIVLDEMDLDWIPVEENLASKRKTLRDVARLE